MPYVGARDPEAIDLMFTQPVGGFDLSTVTGVELKVRSPKNNTLTWAWTLGSQTATELRVSHVFSTDGKDAKEEGSYVVSGWLVTSTSRRRIKPVKVTFERYG